MLAREQDSLQVFNDQTGMPAYAADPAGTIMHIVSGVARQKLLLMPGSQYRSDGANTTPYFGIPK